MAVIRILSVCCAILLVGCDTESPADVFLQDVAAVKRGKSVFAGTCGGYCHSPTRGPRDAPYLFDCVWLHGGSDQEIFNTVSTGVAKTRMISFAGKLPEGDDDIWKVIAYLKSKRDACEVVP